MTGKSARCVESMVVMPHAPGPGADMKTILVAEDEDPVADMLVDMLEGEGYHVVRTSNGRETLDLLPRVKPALILCDVMMPLLDGLAVGRKLQSNPAYRAIPLVFVTALDYRALPTDVPYAAFIAKPFDVDMLLSIVGRLIGPAEE